MRNPSSTETNSSKKKKKKNSTNTTTTTTTTTPCCSKVGLKRGPWTSEEDEILSQYINKEGEGRWRTLPKRAGLLRCGKSCRLRWMNYLRPSVKRGQIAPDEEDLILRLHRLLGNRWSLIAGRIPGRTDNEIKNYWNTHLSKKLISQGIDPRTHKPLDNPSSSSSSKPSPSLIVPNIINNHQITTPNFTSSTPPHQHHQLIATNKESQSCRNDDQILCQYHDYYPDQLVNNNYSDDMLITTSNNNSTMNMNNNDDVFSSFLDSLINEEAFAAHRNVLLQPENDPLISSAPTPALWGSPLMSSNFIQNDNSPNQDQGASSCI